MPFKIERNNIANMRVDAIVNSTSKSGIAPGGAEASIIEAGGAELYKARLELSDLEVTQAILTRGYNLDAKYVIHTVGPHYDKEKRNVNELLTTYSNVLQVAKSAKCKSIAFPLISSGLFSYPKWLASMIAKRAITNFLLEYDMDIHLVLYDDESYFASYGLFTSVSDFIKDNIVYEESLDEMSNMSRRANYSQAPVKKNIHELENRLIHIDEGFSKTLIKLIEKSGEKNSVIYNRANVDKKLFSKIKNNPDYHPSKYIALAFAVALKLNLEETKDFIERAGYALSRSFVFDLVIEYFISKGYYDIFEINGVLFEKDQVLLGSTME